MKKTVNEPGISAGQSDMSQPARTANIRALVTFFESGIKAPGSHGRLGIELEHQVVHDDMSPVPYSAPHGVAWVLGKLKASYPTVTTDAEGDILGVSRPGAAVTIEPAAQIELSAGPFQELSDAQNVFDDFEHQLSDILHPVGERLLTQGYNPTAKARSLELIPKQRYEYMNRYLSQTDTCGPCMMRGSASTQVSIDYTSVADCLRKMRLAFALVPLFSLMCDNAPVFEGKPRTRKLVRTYIWRHMDNDRSGLVTGALNRNFTLADYAAWVLDTPAILVPDGNGGWQYTEQTFGEVYAHRPMRHDDVEHAVSMVFPDVRLKTYVEIRPADSMPIPYAIAYAALIKGLFYAPENLDALDALLADVDAPAFEAAKDALMEHGYAATVYGKPVAELCDALVAYARAGLRADEQAYLEPLANLVSQRITLADLAEQQADA